MKKHWLIVCAAGLLCIIGISCLPIGVNPVGTRDRAAIVRIDGRVSSARVYRLRTGWAIDLPGIFDYVLRPDGQFHAVFVTSNRPLTFLDDSAYMTADFWWPDKFEDFLGTPGERAFADPTGAWDEWTPKLRRTTQGFAFLDVDNRRVELILGPNQAE